jgi:tetratricopeptide (TPR) repeat protein/DNA-binding CsgD family transcriptional regulator
MVVSLDKPIASPLLIGRATQLEAIDRYISGTLAGECGVVLLSGEAGIGKSRLVAEARARAELAGMIILQGNSFEPDRNVSYAPVLDLLRAFKLAHPPDQTTPYWSRAAPELVRVLPELAAQLPGVTPTPPLPPEQEKLRLFETLVYFMLDLAAERPFLLIFEDVHWADDASLEFLLYLIRRLSGRQALLLLTYRDDEVQPQLAHFLATLDRYRYVTEFRLPPLSVAGVEAMLNAIFAMQHFARADFLHVIYSLTEGNPFFIEEVLKSLIASGDIYYENGSWQRKPVGVLRIPRSIDDSVKRRAAQLSDAAREVLLLSAVAGRRFDFTLLQSLTGHSERELLSLIKELLAAQLVSEESPDLFVFRHALTCQSIYSDLLGRERKALHRTIGETLERLYGQGSRNSALSPERREGEAAGQGSRSEAAGSAPDAHAADLGYHYYEAGEWEKALQYGQLAGERARALYSPRAAVEHFTRALDAAQHLEMAPPAQLYRARGLAYSTLGEFDSARADYEAALAAGDLTSKWRSLLDLAVLWKVRDYALASDYIQRAVASARELQGSLQGGDPRALGYCLNHVGNWNVIIDRPLAAMQCHEEALALFEGVGDKMGVAETMVWLGSASYSSGDAIRSANYYRRGVELFSELGDRTRVISSLAALSVRGATPLTDTLLPPPPPPDTRHPTPVTDGETAVKMAREIGWRSGEAFALAMLSFCLGGQGEYGRALETGRSSLDITEEITDYPWMFLANHALGTLYLDLLDLNQARQHLDRALAIARGMNSLYWVRNATGSLASTCILQGEYDRAEALLREASDPDPEAGSPLGAGSPFREDGPTLTVGQRMALCARLEMALAVGDPDEALRIADRLIDTTVNMAQGEVIPRLWKLRGEALAALSRYAEAEECLRSALAAASAQGARPLLWRIHLALGKVYGAAKRQDEAHAEFRAAEVIISELASTLPDGEPLREAFVQHALLMLPPAHSPGTRRAVRQSVGGLTGREVEVAALIASGKSNREIAELLVVGERTIETHVGHVLGKLGFTSRAQIAAWAVEKGLAKHDSA